MLADPYNNASFSIIGGPGVNSTGAYTYGTGTSNSNAQYCPNSVVDNPADIDPCGFGLGGSNVATPPPAQFGFTYPTPVAASIAPTITFYPLARNYFYVNGAERDRLNSDPLTINQIADRYGDGYWPGSIYAVRSAFASPGHVQTSYIVDLDLSTSGLKIGKTLVIQPSLLLSSYGYTYNYTDYGRFLISNVQFYNCNTAAAYTVITVYDAVHAVGSSPAARAVSGHQSISTSMMIASHLTMKMYSIARALAILIGATSRFFSIKMDIRSRTSGVCFHSADILETPG